MDNTLWNFLVNDSPCDCAVPFPWERRYDSEEVFLVYVNRVKGTVVMDLRTRVNLGDELFHESNALDELFPPEFYTKLWDPVREEDSPCVVVRIHNGRSYTFVIPKYMCSLVDCPLCNSPHRSLF